MTVDVLAFFSVTSDLGPAYLSTWIRAFGRESRIFIQIIIIIIINQLDRINGAEVLDRCQEEKTLILKSHLNRPPAIISNASSS